MLVKFLSLVASVLMLFQFMFPAEPQLRERGKAVVEAEPQYDRMKTFDKINGVNDSVFYIERPSSEVNEINASRFGMSAEKEDNYPCFKAALEYCRNNPDTKLTIDNGVYYLDNKEGFGLDGFQNILVEGNGATLVFSNVKIGFQFNNCDCVEFNNIKFDWDWEKLPLSDIAVVKNASPKKGTLDFVFPELENVDENMIFSAVSQCDPQTLTYGAKYSNKEVYVYQNPSMIKTVTKTEKNVLHIEHSGCFKNFKNGDPFIVRHYVYDTTFICLVNGSKNITFDGVHLYGYPGSGFLAGSMASHFQIINSYIGVDPEKKDIHHTSLGADAIHIANTNGCFNIANCDISGQGDDALNVHDGLGWVKKVEGDKIQLEASAIYLSKGDVLKFRDDKFNETDVTAEIKEVRHHPEGAYYDITFTENVSGKVGVNYIANNSSCCSENYVVRNNYIHENRARGFLLQSSNGLCENNRFYKTEMQAIKIVMDISPGLWYEGTGVDNLVIRNNSFDMCDYIATGEVITIGSNIAGATATSQPFTNIEISGNTFTDFAGRVLNADNVNGLVFCGNKIDAGKNLRKSPESARLYFGEYSSNIDCFHNEWKHCIMGGTAKAKKLSQWARINRIKGAL